MYGNPFYSLEELFNKKARSYLCRRERREGIPGDMYKVASTRQ